MGMSIGITVGLREQAESLWTNGIKQNAIFLAEALRHCQNVNTVFLVNTTSIDLTTSMPWDTQKWPTFTFADVKDSIDVLIELGGQIDANATEYLKSRGARLVSYCCGVEYIHAMQSILFNRPLFGKDVFINQRYDEIWMIPQVASNSKPYFEVFRRAPSQVVPFVWSPIFIEERTSKLQNAGCYYPRAQPKRLTVMEPNMDVVKFCLYPILIAESVYRSIPDRIEMLHVTNAINIATNSPEFIGLMNHLDMVKDGKIVFCGRYDTPSFLAQNTDIVISHQWENPLNYFYLEVCWQGFPLVHNASLCSDIGYYYHGNDVCGGGGKLVEVIEGHDSMVTEYRQTQRALISRYLPDNRELVMKYTTLLDNLMKLPTR